MLYNQKPEVFRQAFAEAYGRGEPFAKIAKTLKLSERILLIWRDQMGLPMRYKKVSRNNMKRVYRSSNYFSDAITIVVKRKLDDGTYLVHEHTDCCASYKQDHPDRYRVMSLSDLQNFEAFMVGANGELNHRGVNE